MKIHNVTNQEMEQEIAFDQTVLFNNESCSLNRQSQNVGAGSSKNVYSYYRVKTARNFISYESNEQILRFAATSKVSLLTGKCCNVEETHD